MGHNEIQPIIALWNNVFAIKCGMDFGKYGSLSLSIVWDVQLVPFIVSQSRANENVLANENPMYPMGFKYKHTLTSGSYGCVSLVYNTRAPDTSRFYVVKESIKEKENGIPEDFVRELSVLTCVSSNYIVGLEFVQTAKACPKMVFQYYPTTLDEIIRKHHNGMNIRLAVNYCTQILTCVNYLHERGIVHCDIKPNNFVLRGSHIKIIDFGLSQWNDSLQHPIGLFAALSYRPIEYIEGDAPIRSAGDMWSVGCVIAELVTGHTLFDPNNTKRKGTVLAEIHAALDRKYIIPKSDDWLDFIVSHCIQYRPEGRPTASNLLEYKKFRQDLL